jgi:hypothetical protein
MSVSVACGAEGTGEGNRPSVLETAATVELSRRCCIFQDTSSRPHLATTQCTRSASIVFSRGLLANHTPRFICALPSHPAHLIRGWRLWSLPARTAIQEDHCENSLSILTFDATELSARHHSQEEQVDKFTSPQREPPRSSTTEATTPILTLPNEILYQICEDVFWYHVMLSEVDILRCTSRRCFTHIDMQELKERFVRPRKALLGEALKAPSFSWFKLYGRKLPIPLLPICKRIQKVMQEVLYSYQVFHIHIHNQTPQTRFSLLHGRLQTRGLNLYGHKLRNVMFILYLNTTTRSTASFDCPEQSDNYNPADRYVSCQDKVDDRKKQLRKAIELLMLQREQKLSGISVKCSFTPESLLLNSGPVPQWKVRLVENILQPLDRLKTWVAEVPEVPLESEPDGYRSPFEVYQSEQAAELDSIVDATMRRLLR